MTSTSRRKASGTSHRAHRVPMTVSNPAARKLSSTDTPSSARPSAPREPASMPPNMSTLPRAITAPRRSGGARHWRSEFSGTSRKPLDTPAGTIRTSVNQKFGAKAPTRMIGTASPAAPRGMSPVSTLFAEIRPAHTLPTPTPMAKAAMGSAASESGSPSTSLV